jgi:pimeloyl-ACP methyl ester carboxylesterase
VVAGELRLKTSLGTFAGLAWSNPGAPKVLCLHGWLDNAASFSPIAPCLADYDLVALDLAGHGHSDHRPGGARYHMLDNLWDVDAVIHSLGWDQCILLGHSLGGVVASNYAAAAPEHVQALIVLDGLGALSASADDTAKRLQASMESVRRESRGLKNYPDPEAAARTRHKVSGLPMELSRILADRSLKEEDGHFRWRNDPGLNWKSPSLLMEDQVRNILAAVAAPVLSIVSSEIRAMPWSRKTARRQEVVAHLISHEIDGHHHFHMDQPKRTAGFIIDFLNSLKLEE